MSGNCVSRTRNLHPKLSKRKPRSNLIFTTELPKAQELRTQEPREVMGRRDYKQEIGLKSA